eukprot:CAMPEP_0197250708 /NCGR_PEP_ID=MMETSP1429-20130617/54074_1 /TAXON_ID=49237 /ORGANISM="Chaetoceros  sp., Strain UNC1202" /LENGTH=71 /DNA_ID=CAMNT_0042712605 /DNA_START=116 /DNA_END=328 /DNA_ORIENTATION=+
MIDPFFLIAALAVPVNFLFATDLEEDEDDGLEAFPLVKKEDIDFCDLCGCAFFVSGSFSSNTNGFAIWKSN